MALYRRAIVRMSKPIKGLSAFFINGAGAMYREFYMAETMVLQSIIGNNGAVMQIVCPGRVEILGLGFLLFFRPGAASEGDYFSRPGKVFHAGSDFPFSRALRSLPGRHGPFGGALNCRWPFPSPGSPARCPGVIVSLNLFSASRKFLFLAGGLTFLLKKTIE